MSRSSNLPVSLRSVASTVRSFTPSGAATCAEAADEIERLTRALEKAENENQQHWRDAAASSQANEQLTRERDEAEALAESLQIKWATRPLSNPDLIAANEQLERDVACLEQDVADLILENSAMAQGDSDV